MLGQREVCQTFYRHPLQQLKPFFWFCCQISEPKKQNTTCDWLLLLVHSNKKINTPCMLNQFSWKKTGSYHQSCHPSIQFLNIHPSNFHPPFSPSSHPLEKISLNKYNPMKKIHPLVNPFLPSSGSNWGDLCKKYYSILPFQFPSTIFPFLPSFGKNLFKQI